MPLWDVTGAGASSELGKLWDVTSAGSTTEMKELYDITSAGASSLIWSGDLQIFPNGSHTMGLATLTGGASYLGGSGGNNAAVASGSYYPISAAAYGGTLTTTQVNTTGYNRLEITANVTRDGSTDGYYGGYIGMFSSLSANSAVWALPAAAGGNQIYLIDISTKQGLYYIGARVGGGYLGNGYATVNNIRLYNA